MVVILGLIVMIFRPRTWDRLLTMMSGSSRLPRSTSMTISRNPTILAVDPRMIAPPSLHLHPVLSLYHSAACANSITRTNHQTASQQSNNGTVYSIKTIAAITNQTTINLMQCMFHALTTTNNKLQKQ